MLITLAGPDGAGKSTQAKMLSEWFSEQGRPVKILDKWNVLNAAIHPECRFIKSELDELRVCIAEMKGESRALFLFWSVFQSVIDTEDIHSPDIIYISDGYWIKHAAAEVVYGNNEKWIRGMTSAFPPSDYLFYFDASPDVTAARKQDFTPYECGRHHEMRTDQFLQHQHALKTLMDKWSKEDNWLCVNAEQGAEQVFSEICSHLQSDVHHA